MTERKPENDCLLCQTAKATKTGSHLLPASLVASVFGRRDFEEVHSIKPSNEIPIATTFGRANLKNTNPEQKQLPFVKDYFFCPSCEDRFSILEGVINPILTTKIKDQNQINNFPVTKLDSGTTYITCLKIDPYIFRLYVFSLIWRANLLYRFDTGQEFLRDRNEVDWLRQSMHKYIGKTLEETQSNCKNSELDQLKFVMCGCLEDHDKTTNKAIPHPSYSHPYCFLFNEYLILFHFTIDQLQSPGSFIRLRDFNVDKRIINESGPVKIAISNLANWQHFNKTVSGDAADSFIEIRGKKLSQRTGMPYQNCIVLMREKAYELQKGTEKRFADCFDEAFKIFYNQ